MYESFDHTADVGLRIWAHDLDVLFSEAGKGLAALIVEDPSNIRPAERAEFHIPGRQTDYLLFDWLNELLFQFESEQRLFWQFDVRVTDQGLDGTGFGEVFDADRHGMSHEVKAITYHGLQVKVGPDGWLAEVIVDI